MARAWPAPVSRAEDELILAALSLRDHHKMSYIAIVDELALDLDRDWLIAACRRVDMASDASDRVN